MLRLVWLGLLCICTQVFAADSPKIIILGDSLSAGYGIDLEQSWARQLQAKLSVTKYPYQVVNTSISGETTKGASTRIEAILADHAPAIVIIALGGNDGLRGMPIAEIRQNLLTIINACQQHKAQLLLVKMQIPPNYGPEYTQRFQALYDELGQQYQVRTAKFILAGIYGQAELMQEDGIHPRANAQALMLNNLWPDLLPLLHQ
jgi:acyl-CoA thioesterase I